MPSSLAGTTKRLVVRPLGVFVATATAYADTPGDGHRPKAWLAESTPSPAYCVPAPAFAFGLEALLASVLAQVLCLQVAVGPLVFGPASAADTVNAMPVGLA